MRPALEARALDGSWVSSNEAAWATPPHVDASFARGAWAAGVSLGVPFGSGVHWPGDWPGRHEIVRTEIQVLRAAPFLAWRFGALRVSAGVHVDAARLQIGRNLDFIDMEGDVAIDMSGTGYGVDAAAYWERPGLSIGVAYRGRTRVRLDGGANFTAPPAFANKVPDQPARSELALPDQLVAGTRVQLARSYAALVDVEYTRWATNEKLVVDFAEMQTPDVTQVTDWHDTVALRAGGEWTRKKLVVRHGAYVEQSPAPADRLAPSSPDSTRLGLTAGASWRFDRRFAVDAFVEAMWLLRRDTADAESLQASYGGTATLAGLGVRWTP
ncbi:MAG: outer membrane protein transport protein [Deltaproteobacteria bacterium]|nr:outer membrane protein transport protein [Deltaproteobacteria bacterium]